MNMNGQKDPLDGAAIGVTGAAGFIGARLVQILRKQGVRVRALIHHTPLLTAGVETLRGDIGDTAVLAEFCRGLDGIFHLATALGSRRLSSAEFHRINAESVSRLLEEARRAGVRRVVHFGSAGIFGRTSGRALLKEGDPGCPVDPYEKSKRAGEEAALAWDVPPEVCVIRPGWVYGPGDRRTFKLIRQIHSGLFFIAGRGAIFQTPVYVDDLVEAALAVYRRGRAGKDYNAAGDAVTVNELVAAIARALGVREHYRHVPMSLLLPPAVILESLFRLAGREAFLNRARLAFFRRGKPLDSTRIRRELGVSFPTPLAQGLEQSVRDYRERGWLPES